MKKVILAAMAFLPALAFAQGNNNSGDLSNLNDLLEGIGNLVDTALPIVAGLALLAFFWGLVTFIFRGEDAKSEGKHLMIWGLVALFVMVSVWGLVEFIGNAIGVEQQGGTAEVPQIEGLGQ